LTPASLRKSADELAISTIVGAAKPTVMSAEP
jgi:hypothetical protein